MVYVLPLAACPEDIFVDRAGKIWRCKSVVGEPIVTLQEIESACPETPVTWSNGVSQLADAGFRRIYRQGEDEFGERR